MLSHSLRLPGLEDTHYVSRVPTKYRTERFVWCWLKFDHNFSIKFSNPGGGFKLNLKEIENLRVAIARFLQKEVCGSSNDDIVYEPTPEQCRVFFKKMGGWQPGGNSKVFGYSVVTARKALAAFLNCQPYWANGIGDDQGNANFEKEFVKYLNDENIPGLGPIPLKIFRHGYSGELENFATDEMIEERRDAEYIASRLFDLCGRLPAGTNMLGSKRIRGIFFIAVVKLTPSEEGNLSVGSITFSDLFEPTLEFNAGSVDFGECKVNSVKRINPPDKPHMSDSDFFDYISGIYKPRFGKLNEEGRFRPLKNLFLQNSVRTCVKIVLKYLVPMESLMDDSLGTGSLPRVVLDVEHGILVARKVFQGRFWVLCLSPIQADIEEAEKIFGRDIVECYEETRTRVRKRPH